MSMSGTGHRAGPATSCTSPPDRSPMKRVISLAAALGALAVIASAATPALASTGRSTTNVGIAVSPTRVELHIKPGRTERQVYYVNATGSSRIRVTSRPVAFIENDQGHFMPSNSRLPGSVLGTSWLTVSPSVFTVAPNHDRKVVVTIREPKNAQPGQRYVATIFDAEPGGCQPRQGHGPDDRQRRGRRRDGARRAGQDGARHPVRPACATPVLRRPGRSEGLGSRTRATPWLWWRSPTRSRTGTG